LRDDLFGREPAATRSSREDLGSASDMAPCQPIRDELGISADDSVPGHAEFRRQRAARRQPRAWRKPARVNRVAKAGVELPVQWHGQSRIQRYWR